MLLDEARASLSEAHRGAPARLRDLIARHQRHDFALDPDIIWEVANRHVPALLDEARALRDRFDAPGGTETGRVR